LRTICGYSEYVDGYCLSACLCLSVCLSVCLCVCKHVRLVVAVLGLVGCSSLTEPFPLLDGHIFRQSKFLRVYLCKISPDFAKTFVVIGV
jgi:hypothetical protein